MSERFAPGLYTTAAKADAVAGDWRLAGWTPRVLRVDPDDPDPRRATLTALGRVLRFPEFYGANLDALWECLRDLRDPVVLVWADGGAFADAQPELWEALSDVLVQRTERRPAFAVVLSDTAG